MRQMVTVGERLATLEEQMRGVREDVQLVVRQLGDRSEPDSVRGRLHKMEATLAVIAWRRGVWPRLERFVLLGCSVAVATAAVWRLTHGG